MNTRESELFSLSLVSCGERLVVFSTTNEEEPPPGSLLAMMCVKNKKNTRDFRVKNGPNGVLPQQEKRVKQNKLAGEVDKRDDGVSKFDSTGLVTMTLGFFALSPRKESAT
eukprot:scaffold5135_cov166-Amphora_coffeaeformis.AAC.4